MDYSTPGFPVHHHLLEPTQTQVHHVSDASVFNEVYDFITMGLDLVERDGEDLHYPQ